jgi:hypothetical protein
LHNQKFYHETKYSFVQCRLHQQHFTGIACLVSIGDFTTTRILLETNQLRKPQPKKQVTKTRF